MSTTQLVSNITNSRDTQELLRAYGLSAMKVTWEDTGRTKGSCFGPNISDMTLTVKSQNGDSLMPVIRKPNFSDLTHDVPIESFNLCVGNEPGSVPKIVSLKDYLTELKLFDDRDSVVLTSTQCCVLPVEKGQKTEFAVQLFNYQSSANEPAVLVIMATKDGTSAQILDRSNTKLFFNDKGKARWLSVERLEDVREREGAAKTRVDSFKEMKAEEKLQNTILVIQVPLVQKERTRSLGASIAFALTNGEKLEDLCGDDCWEEYPKFSKGVKKAALRSRGMDMGQIGLGSEVGKYTGTKGVTLVRDTRMPIRCTYQYYRVTDQDNISQKDVADISEQLSQVVSVAKATGSLVIGEKTERLTEHTAPAPPIFSTPPPVLWGQVGMSIF